MNLAIDIGNTALKFAVFEGAAIKEHGSGIDTLNELLAKYYPIIMRAIMASVAENAGVVSLLRKFNIPLIIIDHQTPLPIKNLYQAPKTLGADRLTLAVAANQIYGGVPALIIGAGTCITYNFIEHGGFYGGGIAPGITMRFEALNHFTAKLPYIDWAPHKDEAYKGLVGADSASSIISGVLNGVIQEVQGTIEQYRQRYSGLQVTLTGGDMGFLVKNLKNNIFARPDMVLEGLNFILLYNE